MRLSGTSHLKTRMSHRLHCTNLEDFRHMKKFFANPMLIKPLRPSRVPKKTSRIASMSIVSPKPRMVRFPLAVSRTWTDAETPCLACGELLLIHQPDINAPERLLGTCDTCGAWHVIDCDRAVMVLLPDTDGLRNADAAR